MAIRRIRAGLDGHLFDQVRKGQDAVGDQAERQGQRGFEPRQAACRIVEFDLLVGSGVGGMIAGDHIEGPVARAPPGWPPRSSRAAERRVDLGVGVEVADGLIGQSKSSGAPFRR